MNLSYTDGRTGSQMYLLRTSNGIYLRRLYTPVEKRRHGGAKRLLKRICAVADAENLDIYVEAVPDIDCDLTTRDLEEMYKKHGFTLWAVGTPDMSDVLIRIAQPKRETFD